MTETASYKYNMYAIGKKVVHRTWVDMSLPSRRPSVRLGEFLQDMRSGLDDPGLMLKHRLSESELKKVFGELVRKGFISVSQLRERSKIRESQIFRAFLEDQEGLKTLD